MAYEILIGFALLMAFIIGGAWFYLHLAKTRSINEAIQNFGRLLILICLILISVFVALAFVGG